MSAGVGAIATVLALTVPGYMSPLSGFSYFLMGPSHWLYSVAMGRRRARLIADSR